MYTIHGLFNRFVVPLVYVLLSNKSSATYCKMFSVLRESMFTLTNQPWNPNCIISDFESGLIDAVKGQFPNTKHAGCHFHFIQAVWCNASELNLAIPYWDIPEIAEFLQMCMALAFLPEDYVVSQFNQAFESLTEANKQLCARFTAYFKSTWLNGLFKISMWNKFDQDFLHRTNNRVESWHVALKIESAKQPKYICFNISP